MSWTFKLALLAAASSVSLGADLLSYFETGEETTVPSTTTPDPAVDVVVNNGTTARAELPNHDRASITEATPENAEHERFRRSKEQETAKASSNYEQLTELSRILGERNLLKHSRAGDKNLQSGILMDDEYQYLHRKVRSSDSFQPLKGNALQDDAVVDAFTAPEIFEKFVIGDPSENEDAEYIDYTYFDDEGGFVIYKYKYNATCHPKSCSSGIQFYPHPKYCNAYFVCDFKRDVAAVPVICPTNTYFDVNKSACRRPELNPTTMCNPTFDCSGVMSTP
ncbi:uncharacterized protein LOC108668736 isoform X3 [Hyalella azteca]|uniref:Uncharacterized protein LOC108668736 isoform X3 n=1 Tax=Hyalella azteca TaxID=294128 RepID=A0A8B7ND01_HYAAZ|nr:uncharacterized protein LOC108668736 isoform X3 [Hyalella azteca]